MRVIKDTPLQFGFVTWQLEPPRTSLVIVVKATFEIVPGGVCTLPTYQVPCGGEEYYDADGAKSLKYDTDFALLKRRGECVLLGTCHPPAHERPARISSVLFRVGTVEKKLAVFGDREWHALLAGEPAPFASMPLRWERSYGGDRVLENPVGLGVDTVTSGDGRARRPLPNIENPLELIKAPHDRPTPWGAFPVPRRFAPRAGRVGTYDKHWRERRWPYLPEDFDVRYFNTAPDDQQIDGYWSGDETVLLQNLDPEHARIECSLPGIRARAGLRFRDGHPERFREVTLALDTLVLDVDQRRILATFRGATDVASDKLDEVDWLFIAHDGAETPSGSLEDRFEKSLAKQNDDEAIESDPEIPTTSVAEILAPFRAQLTAANVDFDAMVSALQKPPSPLDLDDARARIAAAREKLRARGQKEPEVFDSLESQLGVIERGSARSGSALRERVMQQLARGEQDFSSQDLTGADLSGLDLSDTVFRGAYLRNVNLTDAILRRAVLDSADLNESELTRADFTAASLRSTWVENTRGGGAVFDQSLLENANFSGSDLARGSFRGARCERAEFVDCTLGEAVFTGATGRDVDFSRAKLDGADFADAVLPQVSFEGASCARAGFSHADLTGIRASQGSDFREAKMQRIRASNGRFRGAILENADLLGADLTRADFSGARLVQTVFDGASMRQSVLRDATLVGARLLRTDAMEAIFDGADLSHADARGANLFGAGFHRCSMDGTRFDLANLKRTTLAR